MKDFKNITFDIIDINVNATPDIYINRNGVTFTKRVLEDLGYPANVQYCVNAENHIFAIRACKANESKAAPFSKPRSEQTATVSTSNKTIVEAVRALMPENTNSKNRYKVVGYFDADNRTVYYDMDTAVVEEFHKKD